MSKWGCAALRRENSRKNMKVSSSIERIVIEKFYSTQLFMAPKKLWDGIFHYDRPMIVRIA